MDERVKHPVVIGAVLTIATYVALSLVNETDVSVYFDPAAIMIVVVAYAVSCAVMVYLTGWWYWTTLGVGIWLTMASMSLYFARLLLRYYGVIDDEYPAMLTGIRAGAVVGSLMVLSGLWLRRKQSQEDGGSV